MSYLNSLVKDLVGFGLRPELVSFSNEQLGSDIYMPCFALAKEQNKSPQEIAIGIVGQIDHPDVEKAEAVAGYVNIWVKPACIAKGLLESGAAEPNYGDKNDNNQTVIVEYVSQNLAKPLSIGHLRNALQGRGLTNLYRSQGYNVVTVNHVGDWGTVFGMWVAGFQKFSNDEKLKAGGNKELGSVYVQMRRALKAEEEAGSTELKDLVQSWLIKLEAGDKEAKDYHSKFSKISIDDTSRLLKQLDIVFDETLGEAFYYDQARQLIAKLVESAQATKQEDGSIIFSLESQGSKVPLLLQKSNGTLLYASSDIATIKYREERWQPKEVVYVVGAEQQFHFKQLFAFNSATKYSKANLVHHWYGLVEELDEDGNRKKMSSRTGAVFLEDVLNIARERAADQAKESLTAEDIEKVALGAVTFREFLQGHKSNVLFDWDDMFSLTGKSGPYVQYACVRLKSILNKAKIVPRVSQDYDWQNERKLLNIVSSYQGVLKEALNERELSKIAFYVYDLTKELNRYYEDTLVLDDNEDVQSSRLWLMQVIYFNLSHALGILGIKIPSKM